MCWKLCPAARKAPSSASVAAPQPRALHQAPPGVKIPELQVPLSSRKVFLLQFFHCWRGSFASQAICKAWCPSGAALCSGAEQRASLERDRGWGRKGFGCLGWGKALCCLTTVTAESAEPLCIKHGDCPRFSAGKLRHAPVDHGFCPQINSLGSGTPSRCLPPLRWDTR